MKNKALIALLAFLFLSLGSFGKDYEIKKQIEKNFRVKENAQLQIENKYGFITIVEGSKNEIEFSIEIIGKGESESIAQEMADRIDIDFNQSGNKVSAVTNITQKNYSCRNCGMTINYTVSVPKSVYMYLINKYGDLRLSTVYQNFKAEVKYGNIFVNRFEGAKNDIWIKYGNLDLEESDQLELDIAYGKINIRSVRNLDLTSAYTTLKAENIDKLQLTSKYDKFNITTLGSADINTAYTDFNIGLLKKNFDVPSIRYGKVRINEIAPDFESIRILAAYTGIRLGLNESHNFYANLSVRYGSIQTSLKFHDVTFPDKADNYTNEIRGIAGNQTNPSSKIEISDSYATIILKQ